MRVRRLLRNCVLHLYIFIKITTEKEREAEHIIRENSRSSLSQRENWGEMCSGVERDREIKRTRMYKFKNKNIIIIIPVQRAWQFRRSLDNRYTIAFVRSGNLRQLRGSNVNKSFCSVRYRIVLIESECHL